eukprot:COSAG02_NODE_285_length_25646_cov_10.858143_14_plen_565_part_00
MGAWWWVRGVMLGVAPGVGVARDDETGSQSAVEGGSEGLVSPLGAGSAVIGRLPNDSPQRAITLSQNGIVHRWRWADDGSEQDMLVLGAGASVSFSGPRLAAVLEEAARAQMNAVERLAAGEPHAPLSLHTSAGGTPEMGPFVDALRPHLPWPEARSVAGDDWFVNLQTEGTSAVLAAVDICLQQAARDDGCTPSTSPRRKVAVGAYSYHGPGSSSFGAASPLGDSFGPKSDQLLYPVPAARNRLASETEAEFHQRILAAFEAFLEAHCDQIGVMLVEPQWGSSLAAQPWPADLLRTFVDLAHERSIYVVCDEIMCGLGRHGAGKLFLSEAWGLEPDVVTFGKSVGGSIFPLAGAVVRRGRRAFFSRDDPATEQERGADSPQMAVLQSHTYAGASGLALMVARATLASVSDWFGNVADRGEQIATTMRFAMRSASAGMLRCHGQGLLWGAEWKLATSEQAEAANEALAAACRAAGVWPYFIKGGFMVTPVLDVDEASLTVALDRLVAAVRAVARSMWQIKALGVSKSRPTSSTATRSARPAGNLVTDDITGPGMSTGLLMSSAL